MTVGCAADRGAGLAQRLALGDELERGREVVL